MWDLARSSDPRTVAISPRLNDIALSLDGRWIAVAERGRIRLGQWPGDRLRVLGQRSGVSEYTSVAFDRDALRVAAAAYDGKNSTVFVWSLRGVNDGAAAAASFTALGEVRALAFSHDGERLLAAGSDGAVRLWDVSKTNAATPIVLRGHHGPVNAAAFSPDDEEVVSGGHDGLVRVWQLSEDGRSVAFRGPGGAVSDVAFKAGGRDVVAVGTRGARVWRCDFCGPIGGVLDRAERMATRSLTTEERALFLHER
jgi:WD40 repeat protein